MKEETIFPTSFCLWCWRFPLEADLSLCHKIRKIESIPDRIARAVLPDKITRRVRQRENAFFGMADIFREGKEDLSSACWLSNRKEADGTADCIKTGL